MQCDVVQVSGTKVWNAFKEEKTEHMLLKLKKRRSQSEQLPR